MTAPWGRRELLVIENTGFNNQIPTDTEHVRVGMLSKQLKSQGGSSLQGALALIQDEILRQTICPPRRPFPTSLLTRRRETKVLKSRLMCLVLHLRELLDRTPSVAAHIINPWYICRLSGDDKRAVSLIPGFPPSPPQLTYPMCGDESARSLKTTSPPQGTGYDPRLHSSSHHDTRPTMDQSSVDRSMPQTIFDATFFCFLLLFLELGLHTGAALG
ncbi:hypothetical protein EDB89DRAFT_482157 [Lactarius sanguifluus]|nr:hypothetical protein EDB89DRAFT_482157 [Lactarius sanguifluus]